VSVAWLLLTCSALGFMRANGIIEAASPPAHTDPARMWSLPASSRDIQT
jgi:hypothetical protein